MGLLALNSTGSGQAEQAGKPSKRADYIQCQPFRHLGFSH